MKLQSMTDFVLEQNDILGTFENFRKIVYNYANFLKQPLELGMFVPCDLVMRKVIVLDKPKEHLENRSLYFKELEIYQQAKETCIFEGLEYNLFPNNRIRFFNKTSKLDEMYSIVFDRDGIIENKTNIESISNYPIQLTQTAIKQLGL